MTAERKFLFKLCHHLGYSTVAELENTMSHKELMEWTLYYSEERFLPDRLEIQLATLSELIYRQVGGKDLTAIDFMPSISSDEKEKQKTLIKHNAMMKSFQEFGE